MCASATASAELPQSLQTLVQAFQSVPDPMAVSGGRRRRRRLPACSSPASHRSCICHHWFRINKAHANSNHLLEPHPQLACFPAHAFLSALLRPWSSLQRYKQLLFCATKLEPFPVEAHTEENKVKGCVSQVGAVGRAGRQSAVDSLLARGPCRCGA